MQKIKSLVHRHSAKNIPAAPALPETAVVAPAPLVETAPITSEALLAQREMLLETETLGNNNVYNDLVQDQATLSGNRLSQGYDASLLQGQRLSTGYDSTLLAGNRSSLGLIRAEPTVLETVQKEVVVHERVHPMEKEEIQPIIYREREQLDVRQITQLMQETEVQPTLIEQRELPAEMREAIIERAAPIPENIILPTREVDAVARSTVVHAPIVEEIIKKTVIEEIQPVVERDIYQPVVIQNTQAIHEKIIEAPTVYREVREVRELGTTNVSGNDAALLREFGYSAGSSQSTYTTAQTSQSTFQDLSGRRLSRGYEHSNLSLSQQNLLQQQNLEQQTPLQQQQMLPTGQVLPQVASSRPAYSYLPPNYTENRPTFMGTGSQYVMAANGLPMGTFAHAKGLPTVNPQTLGMGNNYAAPQFFRSQ